MFEKKGRLRRSRNQKDPMAYVGLVVSVIAVFIVGFASRYLLVRFLPMRFVGLAQWTIIIILGGFLAYRIGKFFKNKQKRSL